MDGDNIIGYNFASPTGEATYKYKIEHKNDRNKFSKMENSKRFDTYNRNEKKLNLYKDVEDNDFTPLIETILQQKIIQYIRSCWYR